MVFLVFVLIVGIIVWLALARGFSKIGNWFYRLIMAPFIEGENNKGDEK